MSLIVKKFSIPPIDNNCYIIINNNKAAIVDAPTNIDEVLKYIKDHNLEALYILLTHGHFDHIGGLDRLKNATNANIVISEGCRYMLDSATGSLGFSDAGFIQPKSQADIIVNDGELLDFDDVKIKVHIISGHTKGDAVYEIENKLFTGDTLFAGSIGRTDLPGGDFDLLSKNLKRLISLPNDYNVFPGHGDSTTIEKEKKTNPYL